MDVESIDIFELILQHKDLRMKQLTVFRKPVKYSVKKLKVITCHIRVTRLI